MSKQTHTAGTITEPLARSISELQQLVANVDAGTAVGLALVTIKRVLQRIDQGLPADRSCWLTVAEAIGRAEGGNIGGTRQ